MSVRDLTILGVFAATHSFKKSRVICSGESRRFLFDPGEERKQFILQILLLQQDRIFVKFSRDHCLGLGPC